MCVYRYNMSMYLHNISTLLLEVYHGNSFSSHHSQGPKQRPHAAPCRGHHQCGRSGNVWSQRRRAVQRPQGGCGRRGFLGVTTGQGFTTFLQTLWYIIGIIFQFLFNWQFFHRIFHIFPYSNIYFMEVGCFFPSPPFQKTHENLGRRPGTRETNSFPEVAETVVQRTWEFPTKIIFRTIIFQVLC